LLTTTTHGIDNILRLQCRYIDNITKVLKLLPLKPREGAV